MKRVFDVTVAGLGLVFLSPLFVAIGIAIRVSDPGPIFYRQERIGRHGKPFRIWKFRTMVTNADRVGLPLTAQNDPRITRIGSSLRASKLDELPQLFNVVLGQMSLVGPRPEVDRYVRCYSDEERAVLDLRPGLTDVASIRYRNENALLETNAGAEDVYLTRIMPAKISLNLEYAARSNFLRDLGVIATTLGCVLGFGPEPIRELPPLANPTSPVSAADAAPSRRAA